MELRPMGRLVRSRWIQENWTFRRIFNASLLLGGAVIKARMYAVICDGSLRWSASLKCQGQRSSHATHLLMLVIICAKYGKNPSRTVDATERTRFSRSRPNDLENIGQGQRSLHATHPLMLMMTSGKYGNNVSRIVDVFSRWKPKIFKKLRKIEILEFCYKLHTRHTL